MPKTFFDTLRTLKPTSSDQRLSSWLGNWTYLQMHLKHNEKTLTERDFLVLMHYEYLGKKRLDILYRLKTRYNSLRNQRELKELDLCR